MGLEGEFYGFGLWKMKFPNIPLIFAGKMPASNILQRNNISIFYGYSNITIFYGYKRMKEEQGLLIQQEKIMDATGIEPMSSR
jgi:hypothetical protein